MLRDNVLKRNNTLPNNMIQRNTMPGSLSSLGSLFSSTKKLHNDAKNSSSNAVTPQTRTLDPAMISTPQNFEYYRYFNGPLLIRLICSHVAHANNPKEAEELLGFFGK